MKMGFDHDPARDGRWRALPACDCGDCDCDDPGGAVCALAGVSGMVMERDADDPAGFDDTSEAVTVLAVTGGLFAVACGYFFHWLTH